MIQTARLRLVEFDDSHLEPLIAMNADPDVMVHFPSPITRTASAQHFDRIRAHWAKNDFGLYALERRDNGAFIGFTGLTHPGYETAFTPCVEVGWRLNRAAWGKSYAYEAAAACLDWGFAGLGLAEIVSFTARENLRSQVLMQRLGMAHDPGEDFEHPMLEIGHRLSWHVLYRINPP